MRYSIEPYEPPPFMLRGDIAVRESEAGSINEDDRVTVHANGIVIDIVSNPDGTVYVEAGAYSRDEQAVVGHAAIDRYQHRRPSLTLVTVPRRTGKEATA